MNTYNSKQVPLLKLFGKLRNLIVVAAPDNTPRRPWGSASARDIQLELDFDHRERMGKTRNSGSIVAVK